MSNIENLRVVSIYERLADEIEKEEFHRYIDEGSEYMPTEIVSRYVERVEVRCGELEDEVDGLRHQVKLLEQEVEELNGKISRGSLGDLPPTEIERLRQGLFNAIDKVVNATTKD